MISNTQSSFPMSHLGTMLHSPEILEETYRQKTTKIWKKYAPKLVGKVYKQNMLEKITPPPQKKNRIKVQEKTKKLVFFA